MNGGGPDTEGENDPDDSDGSYDPWSNGLYARTAPLQ